MLSDRGVDHIQGKPPAGLGWPVGVIVPTRNGSTLLVARYSGLGEGEREPACALCAPRELLIACAAPKPGLLGTTSDMRRPGEGLLPRSISDRSCLLLPSNWSVGRPEVLCLVLVPGKVPDTNSPCSVATCTGPGLLLRMFAGPIECPRESMLGGPGLFVRVVSGRADSPGLLARMEGNCAGDGLVPRIGLGGISSEPCTGDNPRVGGNGSEPRTGDTSILVGP